MEEEIEVLKNVLSRYGLDKNYYAEELLKEKEVAIPSFLIEEEGLSCFPFIADINGKTVYHATLSPNQRFIFIE
ncbi:hypothetical protein [Enterococcus sp. LJL51]|uniref:hypothetical protein n=1 Tax=Enterococcus sp. LJL51 TaxID=3416656 RepID=UPI003CE7E763